MNEPDRMDDLEARASAFLGEGGGILLWAKKTDKGFLAETAILMEATDIEMVEALGAILSSYKKSLTSLAEARGWNPDRFMIAVTIAAQRLEVAHNEILTRIVNAPKAE